MQRTTGAHGGALTAADAGIGLCCRRVDQARSAAAGFEQRQGASLHTKLAGVGGKAFGQAACRIQADTRTGKQGAVAVGGIKRSDGRIHGVSCSQHPGQTLAITGFIQPINGLVG
jgi:hypothetical protein